MWDYCSSFTSALTKKQQEISKCIILLSPLTYILVEHHAYIEIMQLKKENSQLKNQIKMFKKSSQSLLTSPQKS